MVCDFFGKPTKSVMQTIQAAIDIYCQKDKAEVKSAFAGAVPFRHLFMPRLNPEPFTI